jgi:hypothetical protein
MAMYRQSGGLLIGAALLLLPGVALGQNAGIVATATVQPRPLTLRGVALTAVPGELRVRLDGCGSGALAVDVRTVTGTRQTSRAILAATPQCSTRDVTLQLPTNVAGAQAWVVTLQQSDALISPSFAQLILPVTALGARASLGF